MSTEAATEFARATAVAPLGGGAWAGECDATVTDVVDHTVDYGVVCERVALVAQQRSYKTLERLCSVIADRLLDDFEAEEVWVKATKPEPPIALPVEEVSVEVWRQTGEG